ncbi:MAG: hypothetical protein MdMp014T_0778 [Treponematales bacterium]
MYFSNKKRTVVFFVSVLAIALAGHQAGAQQGPGGRRAGAEALRALEGSWTSDDSIKYGLVIKGNNYEVYTGSNRGRADYAGQVRVRGSDLTFEGRVPSSWASVYEFDVDGDYLLLIDKDLRFPITSSGSKTKQWLKNGADSVEFTVEQNGSSRATTTELSLVFPRRGASTARDIAPEDISITSYDNGGEAEISGSIRTNRSQNGLSVIVPIQVSKQGQLRIVLLQPGVKLGNKIKTVYLNAPPAPPPRQQPQRDDRRDREPPQRQPGPPSRR